MARYIDAELLNARIKEQIDRVLDDVHRQRDVARAIGMIDAMAIVNDMLKEEK